MNKKITLLVFIIILAFILSGCRNPMDIFKSFILGQPMKQEENLDPNGIREDEMDGPSKEDLGNNEFFDENSHQITLYYIDDNGYVVPVVRNIEKEEGIARAALLALVDNPKNQTELKVLGLHPVLPSNTQIELAIKEDGLIRASFSEEFLNVEDKKQEEAMISAIVHTLTEFETIDKVQILIDNEIRDTLTFGTEVGQPISRGNINSINNLLEGENARITLYMYNNPTGQYTYFVPITKNVSTSSKNIETAISELIGVKDQCPGLQLNFPDGTVAYNVSLDGGIASVNFSEHMVQLTDIGEANNLTKAIALTLKEFEGVQGVKLVIDGDNTLESDIIDVPAFANRY